MAFKSWFAAALLLSPPLAAQEIKAEILSRMAVSPAELAEICRQLPKCDKDSGGLFKRKSPEAYYFIDHTPQLARFTKGSAYQLKQRWDFADYVHGSEITRAASDPRLSIHSALYPLGRGQWAVALIKGAPDWFSGGAATEEKADFVQLNSDGSHQVALKDIPFYYSLTVKACFQEDEETQILKTSYRNTGKPYYQWQATYTFTQWPTHTPENKATVYTEKQQLVPFEPPGLRPDAR
ncbi:hypothetical protein [Neisseria musculi]|uniref:Uncharacterized protein n=1 Tax=Neisseria musculi TaxID=1815583 RepID=A0A7H1MEN0_9NEIS|nr:hypothetical protein [Neisseria musculi]QNT60095.1 hypothetical protein H7A79_2365 [Neisseria musculi]